MKKLHARAILLALALISSSALVSCSRTVERKPCDEPQGHYGFFELRTFVCKLADSLDRTQTSAIRSIKYMNPDAKSDSASPSWASIMGTFTSLDLNVEAAGNYYKTTQGGSSIIYDYIGPERKTSLPVQKMVVDYDAAGKATKVSVKTYQENILYEHERKLTLVRKPNGEVEVIVEGDEKVLFSGVRHYELAFASR